MRERVDPDIPVPIECKAAWQLAAEREGKTLAEWLNAMFDEITKPKEAR